MAATIREGDADKRFQEELQRFHARLDQTVIDLADKQLNSMVKEQIEEYIYEDIKVKVANLEAKPITSFEKITILQALEIESYKEIEKLIQTPEKPQQESYQTVLDTVDSRPIDSINRQHKPESLAPDLGNQLTECLQSIEIWLSELRSKSYPEGQLQDCVSRAIKALEGWQDEIDGLDMGTRNEAFEAQRLFGAIDRYLEAVSKFHDKAQLVLGLKPDAYSKENVPTVDAGYMSGFPSGVLDDKGRTNYKILDASLKGIKANYSILSRSLLENAVAELVDLRDKRSKEWSHVGASMWGGGEIKKDKAIKLSAAGKMIDLFEGREIIPFNTLELGALREGRLGGIVAKYEQLNLLPGEFKEAEQAVKAAKETGPRPE